MEQLQAKRKNLRRQYRGSCGVVVFAGTVAISAIDTIKLIIILHGGNGGWLAMLLWQLQQAERAEQQAERERERPERAREQQAERERERAERAGERAC